MLNQRTDPTTTPVPAPVPVPVPVPAPVPTQNKEQRRINTIISILTDQRNNALNQVVALQVELAELKEDLKKIMAEKYSTENAKDPVLGDN